MTHVLSFIRIVLGINEKSMKVYFIFGLSLQPFHGRLLEVAVP